jgi:hypothetical protein
MKKKLVGITFLIILGVIIIAFFSLKQNKQETPEATAKCIGENSVLYTQLGCHACEIQEDLFGESYEQLNKIDCFYEMEKCSTKGITATPTWIIKGEKYVGVQSIEKLKELTGC